MDAQQITAIGTLALAGSTVALAVYAAIQAKAARKSAEATAGAVNASKEAMFVQAAVSLWRELETPAAREDRRTVYQEVAKYLPTQPERVELDDSLREPVERVASSFDYIGQLARVDDRLRELVIEFYGVPAIRTWAVLKPYTRYMIDSGRRAHNFHHSFREFAETAARHERFRDAEGISEGREVWVDVGEEEPRRLTI